jgi:hypothetical protein
MKTIKIILGIIAFLVIIIILLFANYGGFSKVNFQIKEEGGETLIYQKVIGSYSQSEAVINEIQYNLKNENVETFKSFCIYYDNPRMVDKSKLQSEVGCILEPADTGKVFWLKVKFNIKTCPVKKYIITEFPYKGKMSIIMSVLKIYPDLIKYVKNNGYSENGPIMEIYDIPNNKILYRKEAIPVMK